MSTSRMVTIFFMSYLLLPHSARAEGKTRIWHLGGSHGKPQATVIYMHGLGGAPGGHVNHLAISALKKCGGRFDVYAPWLRPVKKSDSGTWDADGPHLMTDQLRRVSKLISKVDGKVILVGHSFGGKASNLLATKFKDKVSCVVQFAPSVQMLYAYWKRLTGQRGLPKDTHVIKRAIEKHEAGLRRQLGAVSGDKKAAKHLRDEIGYAHVMADLVGFNEPIVEKTVGKPTLVFQGNFDSSVSPFYARRYAETNKGEIKYVELPNVSHGFRAYAPTKDGDYTVDKLGTKKASEAVLDNMVTFIKQNI